jgi:hypothetical protein
MEHHKKHRTTVFFKLFQVALETKEFKWYKGTALGYSSTNNEPEATNANIK